MHFGIRGQKWGIRRFQYENGTLTPEGKKRYGVSIGEVKKRSDQIQKSDSGRLSYEKQKKLTDSLYKQLMKSSRIDRNAKNLVRDTKVSSGTISKDNDLFLRDRLASTGLRILKEDLDNHQYILEPRKASDGFAIVKRDGHNVSIASYGPEGLIKTDISGKTIKKIEKALGVQDGRMSKLSDSKEDIDRLQQEAHNTLKKDYESKYGKTKEEQKRREREEWDELTRKEDAERDLGKKMEKFDKSSPEEQNKSLNAVKKEMDKLQDKRRKDGGLTSHDDTKLDDLLDWYLEKAYTKNKSLIEDWHAKRFSYGTDFKASEKAQREYAKKLAKALDLPQDMDTYRFLENWFITFDD